MYLEGLFEGIPERLKEKYAEISEIIAHQFERKVLQEWKT